MPDPLIIKKHIEVPIYTTDEMMRLRKFLASETTSIGYHTLEKLANEVGTSIQDLAMLLGLRKKKLEDIKNGKRVFRHMEKLLLYFFDCLYEQKPLLKHTIFQAARSYWIGYQEAGGELPKDQRKLMESVDHESPMNFHHYRQGVLDYVTEQQPIESEDEDEIE